MIQSFRFDTLRGPARAGMLPVLVAFAASLPSIAPAQAQTVVELFTSQSCSSCPPAEAHFKELAARRDLVALEWHVDYWDDLRAGRSGAWKDPYSNPAYTARQRAYNLAIRGRSDVYTPQAVVAGRLDAVGSDRDAVAGLIKAQKRSGGQVAISVMSGESPQFVVSGAPAGAEIYLATFRKHVVTTVASGENHGRKLDSANIVTSLARLTPAPRFDIPRHSAGDGCALVVQEKSGGRILAGAYCPD